ncbi:MAG: hypothetical protein EPN97_06085 [Alphaproteobacteria bacterium]|nr:MAG: hypothetical protein EPN97_06085 [Alphaproteobacteria bacterium]
MKSENLDDLKGRLYEAFDRVVDIAKEDLEVGTIPNRTLAAELLKSASQMAQGIAAIEREQREAREEKGFNKLKVAP